MCPGMATVSGVAGGSITTSPPLGSAAKTSWILPLTYWPEAESPPFTSPLERAPDAPPLFDSDQLAQLTPLVLAQASQSSDHFRFRSPSPLFPVVPHSVMNRGILLIAVLAAARALLFSASAVVAPSMFA